MARLRIASTLVSACLAVATAHAHDWTVLPDGSALGSDGRIWNPATGQWSELADLGPGPHHFAIRPDGHLLARGAAGYSLHAPPALARAVRRPAIAFAPGVLDYGALFRINLADDASIAKVTLVDRDTGQGHHALAFSQTGNTLDVAAPANPQQAPPADYMLFVVDSDGTPSTAPTVRVARTIGPPQRAAEDDTPVWNSGSSAASAGSGTTNDSGTASGAGNVNVDEILDPILDPGSKHDDGHNHGCTIGGTSGDPLFGLMLLAAGLALARRARRDARRLNSATDPRDNT